MKPIITLLACLLGYAGHAQTYNPAKTNWKDAGYRGIRPSFGRLINIANYGADASGTSSSSTALANAIAALNGAPGVVYFPAGTYLFTTAVAVNRDSLIFRGAGYDSTVLRFNLGGSVTNLIQVSGNTTGDTTSLTATAVRGAYTATVTNAAAFRADDWVALTINDQAYMTSSWAYGSLSQLMQVQSVSGNTLTFRSPFRFSYQLADHPVLRRQLPRNNIGFECLKLRRLDATAGQASNLVFENAVNCWVTGIEGDTTNFAHIEINHSSNIEVTNSYLHDAFAYGGNGQGYGVLLQFGSNECKVASNYFNHLRHSMLLQAGANGNVLAYNYSVRPFWTEPGLPDSSAGELVLHGNYPFMNLAEGNFVRNIVIDDSHGRNGPLNTFFRNRAAGYGIFMNFNPPTDSVQFIGNEITNNAVGLYFIQGSGHFQYGNNLKGTIINGTANIPDTSLYLAAGQKPPCPGGYSAWPVAGRPGGYNTGTIYAAARVAQGRPAACSCVATPPSTGISGAVVEDLWALYPNPAGSYFRVAGTAGIDRLELYDASGLLLLKKDKPAGAIAVGELPPGIYMVRLIKGTSVTVRKLIKE